MQGRWRPGDNSCRSCLASNRNRTAPACPPTPDYSSWTQCAQGTKKTLLLCSFGHLTNILWFQSFWFSLKFKTQRPSNLLLVSKYFFLKCSWHFCHRGTTANWIAELKVWGGITLSFSDRPAPSQILTPSFCSPLRQVIQEAHPDSDALILCHLYTKLSSEVFTVPSFLGCAAKKIRVWPISSKQLVFLEPLPLVCCGNIDGSSSKLRPV